MHPLTFPRAGAVGLALTLVVGFPAAVTADTGTSQKPRAPGLLLALDGDELTLDLTDTEREPSRQETPAEPVPVEVSPAALGIDTVWLSGLSAEDADPERAVSATSGVDTTGVDGALDDSVRVTLTEVDGPGAVGLYTDGLAPLLVVEGTGPATAVLPEGEVTEAAWGFAEPGEYTLTFHAAITLPDGGEAVTERTHRLTASPMAAPLPGAPLPQTPERPAVPGSPAQPDEEMSSPRGGTAPRQNTAARPLAADDEPAVGGQAVTLSDGHVDVAGRIIDGDMELSVKDGTRSGATTWRTPDSVVVQVAADARQEWPSGAAYDFLAEPGSDVWMIPQVQRQGVIWAGWNTEEIGADQVDGQVTWTLRDVRGPGGFALFSTTSFGTPRCCSTGRTPPPPSTCPWGRTPTATGPSPRPEAMSSTWR
ncbi:choice-of-anchor M domain-containing protein [Nocardiopsis sp. ARC36]